MSTRVFYGPVQELTHPFDPYRDVYVPIASGETGDVDGPKDFPEGATGWVVYEMRREHVARYEKSILEPEHEVFI